MIPSTKLRAWITDSGAAARTVSAMEQAAREQAAMPPIAALDRGLATAEALGPKAVLDLARRFLADATALHHCIEAAVAFASADPFFRPPLKAVGSSVHTGLLLFHRRALSIQLAVMSAEDLAIKRAFRSGRSSIMFTGQRSVFRFLDSGGATISLWAAPEAGESFRLSEPALCRLVERRILRAGETLEIELHHRSRAARHSLRPGLHSVGSRAPRGRI
jgi:hypothetical protein